MTISTIPLYNKQYIETLAQNADLILLDIDDVIITPKQYLCSSSWYERYHALNKHKIDSHHLIEKIYYCMKKTEYEAVNNYLINDMSHLATHKPVLGFTARIISFAEETSTAIKNSNMQFSNININLDTYHNGVIYVGHDKETAKSNNKGVFLKELLAKEQFKDVKSILFIDDTLKNLQDVESEMPSWITFYGVHFTEVKAKLFCEYTQQQLDGIANDQWQEMLFNNDIPSNNEALSHINNAWIH